MLFIVVNTLLKLSFWKMWEVLLFAALSVVFVVFIEKYAVLQSKTQISDYLTNRKALQDAAVLITIESFIAIAFCFTAFKTFFGEKTKVWKKVLVYFPGILIFPVLFFALTQSIFSFPGVDFKTVTYIVAVATFLIIVLGSLGFNYLLPEKEFKLEVHFLVSLFVMAIGLLTTVNGHVVYAYNTGGNNRMAVIIGLSLFVVLFITGWILNRLKWIRSDRKRIKN